MFLEKLWICLITVFSVILTWYISVLSHEYGHAIMAWLLGYKNHPYNILIGSWYLIPISEAVNYSSILQSGHGSQEALIGISGISVTIILFLVSLFFLNLPNIQKNKLLITFFFWLADINLMEIFSYIPNRTLMMGDIGEFVQGLNISPLWIFILGTIIVGLTLYRFYSYEIIKMYAILPIKTTGMQRVFLWMAFWPLTLTIVYSEPPTSYTVLSYFINIASIFFVMFILYMRDPKRIGLNDLKYNYTHIKHE